MEVSVSKAVLRVKTPFTTARFPTEQANLADLIRVQLTQMSPAQMTAGRGTTTITGVSKAGVVLGHTALLLLSFKTR